MCVNSSRLGVAVSTAENQCITYADIVEAANRLEDQAPPTFGDRFVVFDTNRIPQVQFGI